MSFASTDVRPCATRGGGDRLAVEVSDLHALVVYDSVYGNTEWVAHAIADGLKQHYTVRLVRATTVDLADLKEVDLLVVGAPTQRHQASPAMQKFLDGIPRRSLRGVSAVAFDTRYRMALFFSGSAAIEISRRLKHAGAAMVDEPQSFFMEPDRLGGNGRKHDKELLASGELERAQSWAASLAAPAGRVPVTRT